LGDKQNRLLYGQDAIPVTQPTVSKLIHGLNEKWNKPKALMPTSRPASSFHSS